MTEKQAKKILKLINGSKTILLTTHRNPDGDGIGSGVALMSWLSKKKKKVDFLTRDPMPEIYSFLPYSRRIKPVTKVKKRYDLIIFLECPDADRCGCIIDIEKNCKKSVNIDHHLGNEMYADVNVVNPKAPAVGMQLYKFMKIAKIKIDKNIATGLYTAIITDTGSFNYSNTTPEVHMTVAGLLKAGASPVRISSEVYATTPQSTRLLMKMLSNLKISGRIGWSYLTRKMFSQTGASDSETDNFINSIRSIRNIDIAVLFKEIKPGIVKVSFRSKHGFDVNKIATRLKGGGHKYASGCVVRKQMKKAVPYVVGMVKKSYGGKKRK